MPDTYSISLHAMTEALADRDIAFFFHEIHKFGQVAAKLGEKARFVARHHPSFSPDITVLSEDHPYWPEWRQAVVALDPSGPFAKIRRTPSEQLAEAMKTLTKLAKSLDAMKKDDT